MDAISVFVRLARQMGACLTVFMLHGLFLSLGSGQTTWGVHPTASTDLLEGVAFGNGRFVAVGGGGTIVSSTDGQSWSAETSGEVSSLRGITYGGGQFVVSGEDGTIATSSDGQAWSSQVTPAGVAGKFLSAVSSGGGNYVAVGGVGKIIRSADGVAWSEATTVPFGFFQQSVAYGGGRFVTVGAFGTIMYSTDGDSWTAAASGLPFQSSSVLYGVTWGASEFVAVGSQGKILTSADGHSWVSRTSGVTSALRGVTYSRGRYVVVGADGTLLVSENAEDWCAQTSGVVETLFQVVDGAGRFVAVGGRQSTLDPGVPSRIIESEAAWDASFRWAAAEASASEDSGSLTLQIERLGRSDVLSEVSWALVPGSAELDVDFVDATGMVSFAVGETTKPVSVTLIDDAESEGLEQFSASLTAVTPAWVTGKPDVAQCTIADDEDSDDDGLADTWELNYFGSIATTDGSGDSDADGHDDQREFQDGSDPSDSLSLFYRITLGVIGGGSVSILPMPDLVPPGTTVSLAAVADAGFEFLQWAGALSGSATSETLLVNSDVSLLAFFGVTLAEALDQSAVVWGGGTFGYPWFGQSNVSQDGEDAAWIDGETLPDGEIADLEALVIGPAVVKFWWKVSSSPGNDVLRFNVDGTEISSISGEVDWVQRTEVLSAGIHFLNWSFERSFAFPEGQNAAWVDMVQITVPFADWLATEFTSSELADPLVGGELADPDGDGLNNFEEYAFGLDPKVFSGRDRLPAIESEALVFYRPVFRDEVNYEVQWSTSLDGTWMPSGLEPEIGEVSGGYQRVEFSDLGQGAPRRFFRLGISD